jgi:hypothetical protein
MPEFVRAKCVTSGHEKSIPASWLESEPDAWKALDGKEAVNADGSPLPDKHNKNLSSLSKPTTRGRTADPEKE